MPALREKGAPPKFTGSHEEVKRFIRRFKNLCDAYNLTDQADICERILDYCSNKVVRLVEALPSYTAKDWTLLEADILRYFDADLRETRYIIRDLTLLTKEWKHRPILNLTEWKKYERKFITVAGWLLTKGKITVDEQNAYFWHGIHKKLKGRIESRLFAKTTNLTVTTAFAMNEIILIVETLLARNKFSYNLADSDSDLPDWGYEEQASDSEEETDSTDSEHGKTKKKKKKVISKTRKRKVILEDTSESESEVDIPTRPHKAKKSYSKRELPSKIPEKRITLNAQEGVEQLIKQLSQMSIDDPHYALTYYKAIKLDADVAHCIQSPQLQLTQIQNPPWMNSFNSPSINQYSQQPFPRNSNSPITCYGCGKTGHGLRDCQSLQELINSGTLIRDQSGRVVYHDGTIVRREQGETIIQAANRQSNANGQSHFITLEEVMSEYYISEAEADVMAAQKQPKIITKTRKEVFDGVLLPKRSFQPKDKENISLKPVPIPKPAIKESLPTQSKGTAPIPVPITISSSHEAEPYATQIPIDAWKPHNVNQRLQEITNEAALPQDQPVFKPKPQQSEISMQVGDTEVVNNILNSPITLQVREVLASSHELSDQLTEMIKRRNSKPTVAAHTITASKDRGMLIHLALNCNGKTVKAIIDTGSQLNVVSKETYQKVICLPMNPSRSLTMNDANGGAKKLQGHVENVPLSCGNVVTHANLYIGDNVPFDLLLGRPWQRGNLVSIDERVEGTYLIFKDLHSKGINYELLVEQDVPRPEYGFDVSIAEEIQDSSNYSVTLMHEEQEIRNPPLSTTSSISDLQSYHEPSSLENIQSDSPTPLKDPPEISSPLLITNNFQTKVIIKAGTNETIMIPKHRQGSLLLFLAKSILFIPCIYLSISLEGQYTQDCKRSHSPFTTLWIYFILSTVMLDPSFKNHMDYKPWLAIQSYKPQINSQQADAVFEKTRTQSEAQVMTWFAHCLQKAMYKIRDLVLICNSCLESSVTRFKIDPCYLQPYEVVKHTERGNYFVKELDGALHDRPYASFRLMAYIYQDDPILYELQDEDRPEPSNTPNLDHYRDQAQDSDPWSDEPASEAELDSDVGMSDP